MSCYYITIRDDSVRKRMGTCPAVVILINNFICPIILFGRWSIQNFKFSQYLSDEV